MAEDILNAWPLGTRFEISNNKTDLSYVGDM